MKEESVYTEFDVPPVINAAGTKTRIGGSRIRTEALEGMNRAAEDFVRCQTCRPPRATGSQR
jgi:L-seryl-tRNA(Ser) seleniumtransferase